jgi:hypothetical protein
MSYSANSRGKFAMAIGEHESWRELCHAALEAKDPNELLALSTKSRPVAISGRLG